MDQSKSKKFLKKRPLTGIGGAVFAYIRTSTDRQEESPKAQLEEIRRLYPEITAVFTDTGVSGNTDMGKRPGLAGLLRAINKGDILAVSKRDRLARDAMFSAWLEKESKVRGFYIQAADGSGNDDTPVGKLLRQITAAFAEYEIELIRARTTAVLQAKRKRGERVGGIPYGFSLEADGKNLKENITEQLIIKRIMKMKSRGRGLRWIGRQLDKDNILSPKQRKWNAVTIGKIIKREVEGAYEGARNRVNKEKQT